MGKAVVITSGKGGVGKSTACANLSAALAKAGRRVLAVDADLGLRNLDLLLGVEDQAVYHLLDVIGGNCGLQEAAVQDPRYENLSILPACQTGGKDDLSPDDMCTFIRKTKKEYDYVITDCPAGIDRGFLSAVAGCDEALIVVTPDLSSLRDAERIAGLLEEAGEPKARVMINKVRPHLVKDGGMLKIEEILETMGLDLIGIVPDDEIVITSGNAGTPAVWRGDRPAAQAFLRIARRLDGETVPLPELDPDEKTSFWKRLFRRK